MPYIERRIKSGWFLEIIRYPITYNQLQSRKLPRIPREKLTLEKQKKQNIINAILTLTRLMHCNFTTNDLFITLTFKDKHNIDEKTAMKEIQNYLRRLKYFRASKGLDNLKYIWSMGKDKKNGIHFHMLMSGLSFDESKAIWLKSKKAGIVRISDIEYNDTTGLKDTARYFIENALRVNELKAKDKNTLDEFSKKLFKKWSCSQGLKKPIVSKPRIIKSLRLTDVPQEYKLYKILNYENIATDYGMYQHIQLIKINKMRN